MKRLLLCIPLMLLALCAYATGQDGDVIYINGKRMELLGKPICQDSVLYYALKDALPSDRSTTSSNWDGFTAYWSIDGNKLYLDSVRYEDYNPDVEVFVNKSIPSGTLFRIFNRFSTGNRIEASWVTGKLRAAKGQVIYYQHTGYERNYETETILDINHGKAAGTKTYNNYVRDGFSFDQLQHKGAQDTLRKILPLHFERYPELANVKRFIFKVKRARVDEKGNLLECDVKIIKPEASSQLAKDIADALKAYHPWKVYFINGEYRAYGTENWTMPYFLRDN